MHSTSLATAGAVACHLGFPTSLAKPPIQQPLDELGYGDVTLTSDQHEKQLHDTDALLMELSEDSLLKPFREMAGIHPRARIWALVTGGILLEPDPLLALPRSPRASDRVRFGIVGVGMEGTGLLTTAIQLPGVECVAACDL